MAVAEGLAAKVGLSLGAAGIGATGIYFGNNYLNDYVYISKYERALIAFLNDHEDNDIVFEVKKGATGNEDLEPTDITFSGAGNSSPIKVKVKVSTESTSSSLRRENTSRDSDDSNIEEIKKLGDQNNWTWECSFNFTLADTSKKSEPIKNKDKMWKSTDQGLFGILKKDLTNYPAPSKSGSWTKSDLKRVKADFIRQCGNQRSISENRALSTEEKKANDTEIKIKDINIKFVSKNGSIVPKEEDEATFNYWFKDEFKDRQHSSGS